MKILPFVDPTSLNDNPNHVIFISDYPSNEISSAIQTSTDSISLGTMISSSVDFVPRHKLHITGNMESKWYREI